MIIFIQRLLGVIFLSLIAKAVLAWLASKDIHPELWIVNFIGLTEDGIANHPEITYFLIGLFGLVGLFLGPLICRYGHKIFIQKRSHVWGESSPLGILQKPTFLTFIPSKTQVIDANNIKDLTYDGSGEFTVTFTNPLEGDYEVLPEKNKIISRIIKYSDSVNFIIDQETSEEMTLIFRRIDD